ncbi:NUDIX hydrolase [Kitasatospora aureofaciens]|uniref:NUDIX hydrolase n=1 Tax=Kitasatospora aureofaciens TaxID=1894 RepID=UPI0036F4915E
MIDFDVLTGPVLREGTERIGVGVVVRDASGRLLGMRSTVDPDVWDMPGGTVEHGESPFDAALREAREELGLDLAAENPQALRRRLVAVIRTQADADHPARHDLGLPLTRALHAVWTGPEGDLRLGDEGPAVRMVPFDEVPDLKVPPYMHHYLPLLAAATAVQPDRPDQPTGRNS